jgi:hypothetical protein
MALYGPTTLLFDVTCTATPTPIAARNAAADVTVPTVLSGGFIQIPYNQAGFGFRGTLTAAKGNSAPIVITVSAPDATTTNTTNQGVVAQNPSNLGSISLAAGESTGLLEGVDLSIIRVSGNNQILHVSGQH